MNIMYINMSSRTFLFWCVCIPVRVCIALFTCMLGILADRLTFAFPPFGTVMPTWEFHFGLSFPYLCVAIGFITTTHAKDNVGLFFGGKVWWAESRPLHAVMWMFAWGCVLSGAYEIAGVALGADVLAGAIAGVLYAS